MSNKEKKQKEKVAVYNNIIYNIESWFFICSDKDIHNIVNEIRPFVKNIISDEKLAFLEENVPEAIRVIYALIKSNEMYSNNPSILDIVYSKKTRKKMMKLFGNNINKKRDEIVNHFDALMDVKDE